MNDRELQILTGIVHTRSYQAGEIIFMESEPGAGMYVIESGGVDIILNHASDRPLYLAQLDAGDFFGEMALLGDPELGGEVLGLLIAVPVAASMKIVGTELYRNYSLQVR